jgi:alpha-amylase
LQSTSDSHQIEAWAQFNYAARNGKYSTKKWSCDDFTAVDYDQITQQDAIYKIEAADNDFETDVSTENGNYGRSIFLQVSFSSAHI